jgi:hypothetical protein
LSVIYGRIDLKFGTDLQVDLLKTFNFRVPEYIRIHLDIFEYIEIENMHLFEFCSCFGEFNSIFVIPDV